MMSVTISSLWVVMVSASSSLTALLIDNTTTLLRHHDNPKYALLTHFCPKAQTVEVLNHELIRLMCAGQWTRLKEEK